MAEAMKTLYLAGPMSGIEDYNFPAFNEAAERLREAGYAVMNPAEWGDPELTWAANLRKSLVNLLRCCEAVAVLPGWHVSKGAQIEIDLATTLGMPVYTVEHWVEVAT